MDPDHRCAKDLGYTGKSDSLTVNKAVKSKFVRYPLQKCLLRLFDVCRRKFGLHAEKPPELLTCCM